MYLYQQPHTTGFSLVETLVAITILLIIIVGPMTIASNATQSTSFSNQQVIAYFLAQEGLELAQKARDDRLIVRLDSPGVANAAWDEFTANSGVYADCLTTNGCGLEVDGTNTGTIIIVDCDDGTTSYYDCDLFQDNSSGQRSVYTHTQTSSTTAFSRVINFTETINNQEVLITSEVRWMVDGQFEAQSVTASTYLYNVYGL